MNEEMKQPWTPGPWEVFGGRIIRANDADAGVPLAESRMPYRRGVGSMRASEEEHANAILMAAAPAMAEALALFIGTLEEGRGPRPDPLRLALNRDRCEKEARAALELAGWKWSGR